jgi:methyl-accepting chemotaxis protein
MTIKRLVQVVFAGLLLIAVLTSLIVWWARNSRRELVEIERSLFVSYKLADELRQTSDDLTRFARTYVVTGDPKYEQYFRDVLAIRGGTKPRPQHSERVYWDFVADQGKAPRPSGAPVALLDLMQEAGFTEEELSKLHQAEATSDALVQIEETAMHAVKGQFRDASGAFTVTGPPDQATAIRLMHDAAYHREKARIMAPIDDFLGMVDGRAQARLDVFLRDTAYAYRFMQSLLAIYLGILAVSYAILRRRLPG